MNGRDGQTRGTSDGRTLIPSPDSRKRGTRQRVQSLDKLTDQQLLDLRICDLKLTIQGTWLAPCVRRLYDELADRRLKFRPHCWLSSEWFSPAGVPGVAIPFYLAHPRLMRLENKMMLDVEGGTKTSCMRLLRHEAGHAIEVAYKLDRRPRWRRIFGNASRPYPTHYRPKPFSRDYVLHLDWWYAQSHPTEDFAETFAVWLRPGTMWRRRYRNWPALKKLEYLDNLMNELAGRRPMVTSRERSDPLSALKMTLRAYYEERQARYGSDYPAFYDSDLRRLFSEAPEHAKCPPASQFLRSTGARLRNRVAAWTGVYAYTVDQILREMISRCRDLKLRVHRPTDELRTEVAILLTMQVTNYIHSNEHRLAL
ncbi:MAG TPA: putative zinc-binding metallopeptidase [Phycisphaerae bacterium]|nr:putative zinc-binding metallopeptidase [Phycisphaerae bacterium]